ncbi:hypothetical protein [Miltoncostaea oceani]|jgi:hypothetical protein|uniref:hypothetical protein n=1 Tax=Miltoncostaea oceani TaxID=2843216 RepID=UPI001C3CC900|nr:hypothetical protein [Miltoncostaea oceani]
MAEPDDPIVPPPPAPGHRRAGTIAGLVLIAVAVAVAVAFGLGRADDPGRIVTEVVGVHDAGTRGDTPLPELGDTGFAGFAARDGWTPVGARTDDLEGRRAVTVFWERAGRRIAHTTVSGDPVDAPSGARRTGRRGILLRSFEADGRVAVTWTEGGRTAVISSVGVSRAALYNLAGGRPLR